MRLHNVEAVYPLSPLQAGILFQTLLAPDTDMYVSQFTCGLRGQLDAAAFRRVWESVVARHAVLRTAFVWEQLAEPLQVVRRRVTLPWEEADWQTWAAEAREAALATYRARTRRLPLDHAPLLRLGLHRVAPQHWQFTWTWHHLLLDGWSMARLMEEVLAGYEAYRAGREPSWVARRPYRDYITWLHQQDLAAAEAYWRGALAGVTGPTTIDFGGGVRRPGYRVVDVTLTETETHALRDAARTEQLTLNTVVQGAWALVLSRYAGTRDVMYGAVVSGRPPSLPGVDAMLGLFINTLPVRVRIADAAGIGEWLRALQTEQAEARQYEFAPLVRVQGWSEIPRGTPLFTSIVVFENYGGKRVARCAAETRLAMQDDRLFTQGEYPIALTVLPGSAWTLRFSWDTGVLDEPEIAAAGRALVAVLAAMAEDMRAPVGSLRAAIDRAEADVVSREKAHLAATRAATMTRHRRSRGVGPDPRHTHAR